MEQLMNKGSAIRLIVGRFAAGLAASFFAAATAHAGLLYSIRESDNFLVSIDTNTLAYTVIGATGVGGDFGGLGYDQGSDTLYWIPGRSNNALYTLNRGTGAATLVGTHGINDLFGLEFDSGSGQLYGTQFSGGSGFFRLNTLTGTATTINAGMANQIGGLAFDSTRNRLIGMEDGAGDLYEIDRTNGAQTLLFDGDFVNDSGLAYDRDLDRLWDIDWSGNLYSYDLAGVIARTTRISDLPGGPHDGLAYIGGDFRAVPEPSTILLVGIGLIGLAARRKRTLRSTI